MRYQPITQEGAGTSAVLRVSDNRNPFALGLYALVADTVSDFNIEYTGDNVQEPGYDPDNGNWFSTSIDGASASAAAKFDTPCTALRINIVTGTGSVTLTVVQSGPGG